MSQQDLHLRLERLHEELASTDQVDQETASDLRRLLNDISRLLNEDIATTDADREQLSADVDAVAARLESHPMSYYVNQIADLLGKSGI
ncbi:MAG: DUF4404 family protein [Planctomycetota bacterium]